LARYEIQTHRCITEHKWEVFACPRCKNEFGIIKCGSVPSSRGRIQRWKCNSCGKKFHPSLKTQPIQKVQAYLDIETSNLKAPFGIMWSWALKPRGRAIVYTGYLKKRGRLQEKEILKDLIASFVNYDEIITWYGRRFDVPFLLTRSLYHRLPFVEYGSMSHDDLYTFAKYRLLMHSNRLDAVARFLRVKDTKTPVEGEIWNDATYGTEREFKRAMGYIVKHNIQDVRVLEQVHELVEPYYRGANRSI